MTLRTIHHILKSDFRKNVLWPTVAKKLIDLVDYRQPIITPDLEHLLPDQPVLAHDFMSPPLNRERFILCDPSHSSTIQHNGTQEERW